MPAQKQISLPTPSKGRLLFLIAVLVLAVLLVPHFKEFSSSFNILSGTRPEGVLAGVALVTLSYLLAALQYKALAFKTLRVWPTFLVQVAGSCVNRLLPAGIGGLTVNVQYLRRTKHTAAQAIAVPGANNAIGFVGHMLLLVVLVLTGLASPGLLWKAPHLSWLVILVGVLAVVLIANILVFQKLRRYLYRLSADLLGVVASYSKRPERLAIALGIALLLTATYVTILFVSMIALGGTVSWVQTFVVFTAGIFAATATPTPGGIVGAEAGLTAGFLLYGVPAPLALAAALLFRLLTYWLPLVAGFFALLGVRKHLL